MYRQLFCGVALMLLLTSCSRAGSAEELLDRLQGDWKFESLVIDGTTAPDDLVSKMSLSIKGDQMVPTDSPNDKAAIKLDASANPIGIDLKGAKQHDIGIVRLEGDKLTLCLAAKGKARPSTFEASKGSQAQLWVLKRSVK
ncbi:MAG: TIGR03067 domain-containing protein [Burkholderiales bacterium]|nr:TIGR03067 domain-containing protein [Phycisphaerae bacterium]